MFVRRNPRELVLSDQPDSLEDREEELGVRKTESQSHRGGRQGNLYPQIYPMRALCGAPHPSTMGSRLWLVRWSRMDCLG